MCTGTRYVVCCRSPIVKHGSARCFYMFCQSAKSSMPDCFLSPGQKPGIEFCLLAFFCHLFDFSSLLSFISLVYKQVADGFREFIIIIVIIIIMARSDQPQHPTIVICHQNDLSPASSRASVTHIPMSRRIWWIHVVRGRPRVRLQSGDGRSPS